MITTIVHFSLPKENADKWLAKWRQEIEPVMIKQPGAIDGIFYRCIDEDSPFQFVNVARWESPEALANALQAFAHEQKQRGMDIVEFMNGLDIKVSQNNYVEEIRY
jgi:heme-degrading monooxygenase HmoA